MTEDKKDKLIEILLDKIIELSDRLSNKNDRSRCYPWYPNYPTYPWTWTTTTDGAGNTSYIITDSDQNTEEFVKNVTAK